MSGPNVVGAAMAGGAGEALVLALLLLGRRVSVVPPGTWLFMWASVLFWSFTAIAAGVPWRATSAGVGLLVFSWGTWAWAYAPRPHNGKGDA